MLSIQNELALVALFASVWAAGSVALACGVAPLIGEVGWPAEIASCTPKARLVLPAHVHSSSLVPP